MMAVGAGSDGFAVRHARRAGGDFDMVLFCQPVENVAHVQIAETADDSLVARRIVCDAEAWIFGRKLVQRFPDALFVAAAPGLDRETVHRQRVSGWHQPDMVFVM
jgi:hypothetical protein